MSKRVRHLHLDYNTTYCGRDASHILMTYDLAEVTCRSCIAAFEAAAKAREAEAAGHD